MSSALHAPAARRPPARGSRQTSPAPRRSRCARGLIRALPGSALPAGIPFSPAFCAAALLLAHLGTAAATAQELPRVDAVEAGFSHAGIERLDAFLNDYTSNGSLSGAVAMVLRDGAVVYERAAGFRDIESGDLMRPDAIFRIASQTKAIVSVAVMMLQDEGALLISDRVGRYLTAFARTTVAVPNGEGGGYEIVGADRAITIRDLLTHTAGIAYGNGPGGDLWREAEITGWYFAHRDEPVRATVDRMAELPFQAQPGSRFVYGYATDILGALVEEVSGVPLDEFLHGRIFEPLGMHDTHFYLPPDKRHRLATVYGHDGEGKLTRSPDGPGMNTQGQYADGPRVSFSGGAGLLSTARDYSRFLQMMLNGGSLGDARILSPSSVDLMTTNHIGDLMGRGTGFGLGFQVRLDLGEAGAPGSVGDYGWGGAYHTTYWVDPAERLVVVYFTQLRSFRPVDDHGKLRALVYGALAR